jgi:hypothetical protein
MRPRYLTAFAAGALLFYFPLGHAFTYVVKKGDTLSHDVAGNQVAGPVWGPNGSLRKIIELNPKLKNPDHLMPGQKIDLTGLVENPKETTQTTLPIANETVDPSPLPEKSKSESPALRSNASFFSFIISPIAFISSTEFTDKANSGVADLSSNFSYGLDLGLEYHWNPAISSRFFLNYTHLMLEENSSVTLSEKSKSLIGLTYEQVWHYSPSGDFSLTGAYRQELFTTGLSGNRIGIDSTFVPSSGLQISQNLFRLGSTDFGVSGLFKLELPANNHSYHVNLGESFGGAFYLGQSEATHHLTWQAEAGLEARNQETSNVIQKEQNIFLRLKFTSPAD